MLCKHGILLVWLAPKLPLKDLPLHDFVLVLILG